MIKIAKLRTSRFVAFAAAALTTIGLGLVAPASQAVDQVVLETVLLNNTGKPLTLRPDWSPQQGWTVPPPAHIAPGEVVTWSMVIPPNEFLRTVVYYRSDDGNYDVRVSTAGRENRLSEMLCNEDPIQTPALKCKTFLASSFPPDRVVGHVTLGPRLDGRNALSTVPAEPTAGRGFVINATVADEPNPLLPNGWVTFLIDGEYNKCTNPRTYYMPRAVEDGLATCETTLLTAGNHTITAKFVDAARFLDKDVTLVVHVNELGFVRTVFQPTRGAGWDQGQGVGAVEVVGLPPGAADQVTTSHDGSQMVAIGSDGVVYHTLTRLPGAGVSSFASINGVDPGAMKAFRVAVDTEPGVGQAQVVALGLDHRVWHRIRYDDGSWTAWGLTDRDFQATDIAVAIDAADLAHVVAVGLDGTVWHRVRYRDGGWSRWAYPSGYNSAITLKATKVAVAAERGGSHDGRLTLVTIGTDGRMYRATRNTDGRWAAVDQLTVLPDGAKPKDIAIAYTQMTINGVQQQIGLFAVTGDNGQVYRSLRIDGHWTSFERAGISAELANVAVSSTPETPGLAITTFP